MCRQSSILIKASESQPQSWAPVSFMDLCICTLKSFAEPSAAHCPQHSPYVTDDPGEQEHKSFLTYLCSLLSPSKPGSKHVVCREASSNAWAPRTRKDQVCFSSHCSGTKWRITPWPLLNDLWRKWNCHFSSSWMNCSSPSQHLKCQHLNSHIHQKHELN